MAETLLILGGTRDARRLADRLAAAGHRVIYSLAGRTSGPNLPETQVIRGGFGGADGLADALRAHGIDRLIDASHPFAQQISRHARQAAQRAEVPLLRLVRPGWTPQPGDRWIPARDPEDAFAIAARNGRHVLVTSGRKGLDTLPRGDGLAWLVRLAEAGDDLPRREDVDYLFARGPFAEAEERALMESRRIDGLVSKNSGGDRSKLDAARALNIPVVMISRPDDNALDPADTFDSPEALARAIG